MPVYQGRQGGQCGDTDRLVAVFVIIIVPYPTLSDLGGDMCEQVP